MNQMIFKPTTYFCLFLLFISILLFLVSPVASDPLTGLNATCLTSDEPGMHESPSIAVWQQTIHIVWSTQDFENSTISYKKSLDNGKTWSNTIEISPGMKHAYYPIISAYKNTVHVVWIDYRGTNSEIYYAQSIDDGETWDTAQRLTYDSPIKNCIYDTVIVTDKDNVYLAWKDYRTGSSEIFFKRSKDSGVTWSEDQRLTKDYSPSYCPCLAVDENYIYIAYQDGGLKTDICFLKSDSSGEEWSEKTYIVATEEASKNPCLAVSKNILYLVWQNDKTGLNEIYFKKSDNRGETWGEIQQLSSNSTSCINPKVYTYDEKIVVIWQELIDKMFCISYTTSNDSGKTWTQQKQLTTDTDSYSVGICGEEENIHIIYQEYHTGNWADIRHIGNYSKTSAPKIVEPTEPNTNNNNNNTPAFQFNIIVLSIIVMSIMKIILPKIKREN